MSDAPTLRAELKKLSARAMQLKMDLHDLSEDLPRGWELIPKIAGDAFKAFGDLQAKRAELEATERAAEEPGAKP